MNLPGYDEWKTHNPADDLCQHCGANPRQTKGWQPDCCSGKCGIAWRDPDAEYDAQRDAKADYR